MLIVSPPVAASRLPRMGTGVGREEQPRSPAKAPQRPLSDINVVHGLVIVWWLHHTLRLALTLPSQLKRLLSPPFAGFLEQWQ